MKILRKGVSDVENLANISFIVSIVAFSIAGVSLIAAIFIWFKFDILKVIDDLSGRSARRSIEQMRLENEKSGKKSYRPHPVASDRGTITEQIKQQSGSLKKSKSQNKQKEQVKNSAAAVKKVNASAVTDQLDQTTPFNFDSSGTEVLNEGTQVLTNEQINKALDKPGAKINIIQNIVFVHTDETI